MSEPLTPIPSPPNQLWRQLRLQYLPVVIFVAGVVAAAVLWHEWVAPPTLVAEVETTRADVRSARAGVLGKSSVSLLQTVRAGDVLARVVVAEPAVIEASLAVLRSELESLRVTMDPVVGQQRIALDYERLLLDVLHAKVEFAALQAQLFQAESNFTRTNTLFASKLVAEERFEEVKNTRDSLAAQVKAQKELIERVEPGLKMFTEGGPNGAPPSPADGLRAALKVQEDKLRLLQAQLAPVALTAPIDGVVTLIQRQPGEGIVAGEVVYQITATRAERLVGYIRGPVTHDLKPGASVEVRTRTPQRQQGSAKIVQVGRQLEPISATLLAAMRLPISHPSTELGLRVLVSVPAGMTLLPGQQVDVVFEN